MKYLCVSDVRGCVNWTRTHFASQALGATGLVAATGTRSHCPAQSLAKHRAGCVDCNRVAGYTARPAGCRLASEHHGD